MYNIKQHIFRYSLLYHNIILTTFTELQNCHIAAAYVALRSIVLVELLGIEQLTRSFGLLLLFQGLASIIGPPLAGE